VHLWFIIWKFGIGNNRQLHMLNHSCFIYLWAQYDRCFEKNLLLIPSFSNPLFPWAGSWDSSPRRTRNTCTSQFSAISDISAGSAPRQCHARSEMLSRHLIIGRPLGRFPVGVASTNVSWDILVTWPNQRNRDFSHQRSGSTFRDLRILQLRTFWGSVTPRALRKNPIFAVCTWDGTYPRFMTVDKDRNKDRFRNWQLCGVWNRAVEPGLKFRAPALGI